MIDKSPALLPRGPLKVHDSLPHYGNFINGQQVAPQGGRFFASNEPFSGQPWAMIAEADEADVDAATQAAWRAGNEGPWASFSATERGSCIRRIADLIAANEAWLGDIAKHDHGKLASEVGGHIRYMADSYHYYTGYR